MVEGRDLRTRLYTEADGPGGPQFKRTACPEESRVIILPTGEWERGNDALPGCAQRARPKPTRRPLMFIRTTPPWRVDGPCGAFESYREMNVWQEANKKVCCNPGTVVLRVQKTGIARRECCPGFPRRPKAIYGSIARGLRTGILMSIFRFRRGRRARNRIASPMPSADEDGSGMKAVSTTVPGV